MDYFLILQDRPELTPVAIRAGKLLAQRMFAGATQQMDYDKVREPSLFLEVGMELWEGKRNHSTSDGVR